MIQVKTYCHYSLIMNMHSRCKLPWELFCDEIRALRLVLGQGISVCVYRCHRGAEADIKYW